MDLFCAKLDRFFEKIASEVRNRALLASSKHIFQISKDEFFVKPSTNETIYGKIKSVYMKFVSPLCGGMESLMKIAFCDDDALCRSELEALLSEYVAMHPDRDMTYTAFAYSDDILEASAKIGGFDLYILDIVLQNDINGIELGVKLRQASHEGKIVYLTSSEEYAIDSFKVKPYDYLMKPVEKSAFFKVLDELYEIISHESSNNLVIKMKESSTVVKFDSILYAELVKRAVVYQLVGGKTLESTTLRKNFSDAMADLLADRRFVLCGSGMVVNLHHVKSVEVDSIVFRNGTKVLLSKKICRSIRAEWNQFWFEEVSRKE